MTQSKRNALLLLLLSGICILILAMSLPQLTLSPAQPFTLGGEDAGGSGVSGALTESNLFLLMLRGVFGAIGVLFVIYVIFSLFSKEGRQRLLFNLILLIIVFALGSYLQRFTPEQEVLQQVSPQAMMGQEEMPLSDSPEAVFSPEPPNWIAPIVLILISGLTVGVLFWARRFFMRSKPIPSPLEEFAQEAQQAIESLNTGQDFKVTVINCYQEMNRIVKEQKSIERNSTMTVREFEDYLINAGLPEDAIQMLSRLFERVRYGAALEQSEDEALALACLTDIVDACRNIGVRSGV